jgi:hypothetical protein
MQRVYDVSSPYFSKKDGSRGFQSSSSQKRLFPQTTNKAPEVHPSAFFFVHSIVFFRDQWW